MTLCVNNDFEGDSNRVFVKDGVPGELGVEGGAVNRLLPDGNGFFAVAHQDLHPLYDFEDSGHPNEDNSDKVFNASPTPAVNM
jgi:hypothetical protein